MPEAIRVEHVSRSFGSARSRVDAVTDVSFAIEAGQTVALLGANGAGKTTMIKILATLLTPTAGRAWIHGHDVARDPKSARRLTSVVFGGERGLYTRLSGRDNLRFFAMLGGLGRRELNSRVREVLEQLNLAAVADRRVETYSRGMRQRLHLAIGLVTRPRVLLLDEPTIGLDPVEAQRLRATIAQLRSERVTVLLTSHYLLDVERLADRVLLLADGQITRDLEPGQFARESQCAATVRLRGGGPAPAAFPALPGEVSVAEVVEDGAGWLAELRVSEWNGQVFAALEGLAGVLGTLDIQVSESRLEEAFMRLSQSSRG